MPEIVERTAKLFEAGEYLDKGIEFSEEDLDNLIAAFKEVPVKIEHQETPFDGALGVLKRVWRSGKDLMGSIGFSALAWAFIDKANARKLSIAVTKDKNSITEVSLVRNPRVATAQVFDGSIRMHGEIPENMNSITSATNVQKLIDENCELKRQIRLQEASTALEHFKRCGKLVPATEKIAEAILTARNDAVVEFAGEKLDFSRIFCRFLEAMPEVVSFGEQAKAKLQAEQISSEQIELAQRLGLDIKTASKYLAD